MRDSSMFYFNISINYCTGCKYSPHPWLALGARIQEAAIGNCGGKIQPYALTDDGPTAEQPQGAPIGRLAFPGLAKRARRGATRARPGIKPTSCPPRNYLRRFAVAPLGKSPTFAESAKMGHPRKNRATSIARAPSRARTRGMGCASELGPKNF